MLAACGGDNLFLDPDAGGGDGAAQGDDTTDDGGASNDATSSQDSAHANDSGGPRPDGAPPDGAPPPDGGGSCGSCTATQVCCAAPLGCAGQCVPDCRQGGSCPNNLTCDTSSGVCSPSGGPDGGGPGPDGGGPGPDGGGPGPDGGGPGPDGGGPHPDGGGPGGPDGGGLGSDGGADSGVTTTPPPTGTGEAAGYLGDARTTEEGNSVAIDNDTVVLGRDFTSTSSPGHADVYRWTNGAWALEQTLAATTPINYDLFGGAVAISGDRVVVGARFSGVNYYGKAYIFERSGTTWSQAAALDSNDPQSQADFGEAVAVSGDTVLVGAPQDNQLGSNATYFFSGSVNVYTPGKVSGHWNNPATILPPDLAKYDMFGWDIAYDGTTAIISAPSYDKSTSSAGRVFPYTGAKASWTEGTVVAPADGAVADHFGASVALFGTTMVVGSPDHDGGAGTSSGAVYVYTGSSGSYTLQQELTPSDAAAADQFGYRVGAVSEDRIVVTALGSGKVYVFSRSGGTWSEETPIRTACSYTLGLDMAAQGGLAVVAVDRPSNVTVNRAFVLDLDDPSTACLP